MFRKMTAAAVAVLVLSQLAMAQPRATISGSWEGSWTNSRGSQGEDWLDVVEEPSGRIYGTWGEVEIEGTRQGLGRYVWQGSNKGRSYRATAQVGRGGRALRVDYEVTYRRQGELRTYGGQSHLRRVGY